MTASAPDRSGSASRVRRPRNAARSRKSAADFLKDWLWQPWYAKTWWAATIAFWIGVGVAWASMGRLPPEVETFTLLMVVMTPWIPGFLLIAAGLIGAVARGEITITTTYNPYLLNQWNQRVSGDNYGEDFALGSGGFNNGTAGGAAGYAHYRSTRDS